MGIKVQWEILKHRMREERHPRQKKWNDQTLRSTLPGMVRNRHGVQGGGRESFCEWKQWEVISFLCCYYFFLVAIIFDVLF